jgi:hypothetical protein
VLKGFVWATRKGTGDDDMPALVPETVVDAEGEAEGRTHNFIYSTI